MSEAACIQVGLYWTRFPNSDQRHSRVPLSLFHDDVIGGSPSLRTIITLSSLRRDVLKPHLTEAVATSTPLCRTYAPSEYQQVYPNQSLLLISSASQSPTRVRNLENSPKH